MLLGVVIHFAGWKMNKQQWSPSYLFFMAGAAGALLSLLYIVLDRKDGAAASDERRASSEHSPAFGVQDSPPQARARRGPAPPQPLPMPHPSPRSCRGRSPQIPDRHFYRFRRVYICALSLCTSGSMVRLRPRE